MRALAAPRITVSIPVFQARPYLRRAVESILTQTHSDLVLVVVNDGDPEQPWDELSNISDPRLIRFDLDTNRGRYFADAVVLNATTDPYFLVQDADDWSEPDRISILLERMRQDNSHAAVSAIFEHVLDRDQMPCNKVLRFERLREPLTPEYLHRGPHHGLFRCQALRRIGGPFGGFSFSYDKLLVNLLLMTGRVSYVELPLYHYLIRPNSLTTSDLTGKGSRARLEVSQQLHSIYSAAFSSYLRCKAGKIDAATLAASIRRLCNQYVTPRDIADLSAASSALRALMQRAQSHGRVAASPM